MTTIEPSKQHHTGPMEGWLMELKHPPFVNPPYFSEELRAKAREQDEALERAVTVGERAATAAESLIKDVAERDRRIGLLVAALESMVGTWSEQQNYMELNDLDTSDETAMAMANGWCRVAARAALDAAKGAT